MWRAWVIRHGFNRRRGEPCQRTAVTTCTRTRDIAVFDICCDGDDPGRAARMAHIAVIRRRHMEFMCTGQLTRDRAGRHPHAAAVARYTRARGVTVIEGGIRRKQGIGRIVAVCTCIARRDVGAVSAIGFTDHQHTIKGLPRVATFTGTGNLGVIDAPRCGERGSIMTRLAHVARCQMAFVWPLQLAGGGSAIVTADTIPRDAGVIFSGRAGEGGGTAMAVFAHIAGASYPRIMSLVLALNDDAAAQGNGSAMATDTGT